MVSGMTSYLSFLRSWCLVTAVPCYLLQPQRFKKAYLAYHVLAEISFIILVIRFNAIWFLPWLSLSDKLEMISPTFFQIQESTRLVFLYLVLRRYDAYLQANDDVLDLKMFKGEDFKELWRSVYRGPRRVFMFIILCNTLMILGVYVPPYFITGGKDTLPAVYPFFDSHLLIKIIYFFLDETGIYLCLMKSTIADLFCVTWIAYHTAQLQHLRVNLRTILHEPSCGSRNLKEACDAWILAHASVLRLVGEAKAFWQPMLFVTYMFSLVNVVETVLMFTLSGQMEAAEKAFGLVVNAASFASLGWLSRLVDKLEEEHELMTYEFDMVQVSTGPGWLKSFYLITSSRCGKPFKVSAFGFYKLSSKAFTEVVTGTVSLMATMYQLRGKFNVE